MLARAVLVPYPRHPRPSPTPAPSASTAAPRKASPPASSSCFSTPVSQRPKPPRPARTRRLGRPHDSHQPPAPPLAGCHRPRLRPQRPRTPPHRHLPLARRRATGNGRPSHLVPPRPRQPPATGQCKVRSQPQLRRPPLPRPRRRPSPLPLVLLPQPLCPIENFGPGRIRVPLHPGVGPAQCHLILRVRDQYPTPFSRYARLPLP